MDIAFYGTNLNQAVILSLMGFAPENEGPWQTLFKQALGNLILSLLGALPGYFVTVFFIERIGRLPIQYTGFILVGVLFIILGAAWDPIRNASVALFIVLFAIAQVSHISTKDRRDTRDLNAFVIVLFQFWAKLNHFCASSRSVSYTSSSKSTRHFIRVGQAGCYHCYILFQRAGGCGWPARQGHLYLGRPYYFWLSDAHLCLLYSLDSRDNGQESRPL